MHWQSKIRYDVKLQLLSISSTMLRILSRYDAKITEILTPLAFFPQYSIDRPSFKNLAIDVKSVVTFEK